MKNWRGYLTAIIFAAITWGFVHFAKTHPVMIDMVYPYITRMIQGFLAEWSIGVDFCVWQLVAMLLVVAVIATLVLAFVFLHESFTAKSLLGCALIGMGTLLMVL